MHKALKKKESPLRIGVDLAGSELSSKELLQALLDFLRSSSESLSLFLFAPASVFEGVSLPKTAVPVVAEQVILLEDAPLLAIRRKRRSSLCLGIDMLSEKKIDAFVSAGNTGALMGYAKLRLPDVPGVERPALLALLPTQGNAMAVLDVGANTTCTAQQLEQFALLGIAYQKSRGIACPRVGLLNIGTEAKKGTPELQKAYKLLQKLLKTKKSGGVFVGNIEARDAFKGEVDVLVTEGFTGNVFLKTAEGIATALFEKIEKLVPDKRSSLRTHLHYAEYPGALLAGVGGIVMKCHSSTSCRSVVHTVAYAIDLVKQNYGANLRT